MMVNGEFVDPPEARIAALDAGLQHAVGLFETMLGALVEGSPRVFFVREHVDRLVRSARELGLSHDLRAPALVQALERTVARAGIARARIRLTITGGVASRPAPGAAGQSPGLPGVIVHVQPATQYAEEMFERGVSAGIAASRLARANPLDGHKTLAYWWRLRELHNAGARGLAEAIVLHDDNRLASGCVSNLFIVRAGCLRTPCARTDDAPRAREADLAAELARSPLTPAQPGPVLPGITRAFVLESAAMMGVEPEIADLTIDDLLDADEVFLTNSLWGVLPVVRVEAKVIGTGTPGELARRLRRAWTLATT
jgi:branched-chain amino acid aminotransferase